MSDVLTKLDNFLFDILGLVLPGLIFLTIIICPIYLIDFPNISKAVVVSNPILSIYSDIQLLLNDITKINGSILIVITLITGYILGHFVKVFSIIKYDFLSVLFDKSINKFFDTIYKFGKTKINMLIKKFTHEDIYNKQWYLYLKTLASPVKNTILKIFTFKSADYFSDNDELRQQCISIINQKLGLNYPDKWYSLYKFSAIINSQENIKSLAGNFLAKYNLYRSMSFIFLFSFIYFMYLFSEISCFIASKHSNISSVILIVCCLLWFTFHYKFKRYWTLCGNEMLVSLYYFLSKKKIHEN